MCQIWYIDCRAQPKFDDGFTKPVAGNLSLPSPVHDNMEHRTVIRSLTWQTEFLMRKPGRMSTTSCHDLNILFKNKLRMVRRTHLLTYLNKCCINEFKVQSDHINSHHKLTYGRGLVPYWLLSISPWLSAVVEPKQAIVIVRSRCGERARASDGILRPMRYYVCNVSTLPPGVSPPAQCSHCLTHLLSISDHASTPEIF